MRRLATAARSYGGSLATSSVTWVACCWPTMRNGVSSSSFISGLIPAARGRGWGRELLRAALQLAQELSREQMVLAVDANNGSGYCDLLS